MMAIVKTEKKQPEKRIALRLQGWLYDDLKESADRSGWDVSKQVRHELAALRGKAPTPYLPTPIPVDSRFKGPAHGTPGKKTRKGPKAA